MVTTPVLAFFKGGLIKAKIMTTTNFLTIDFTGENERVPFDFTSDKPLETNEEIIQAAKDFSDRANSPDESYVIGLWEDVGRLRIKKFVPINDKSGFSAAHKEYFAALTWKNLSDKYCDHILGLIPEYDPENHETALLYEEGTAEETGYNRALEYLRETEDRLLEEVHDQLKKLPGYASQATDMEMLFERAKTDPKIRAHMLDKVAHTK